MKTTIIEWHSVADGDLPEKSGHYLATYLDSMHFSEMAYSKKYKAFNVCDFYTGELRKLHEIKVDYWAELPQLNKE